MGATTLTALGSVPRYRVRYVLAAALAVVAGGCAGSGGAADQSAPDDRTSPTPGLTNPVPYPGAGEDCPTRDPTPITVSGAIAALREHGFSASAVDRSCGLRTISAMLTNAAAPFGDEGTLNCFVLVEAGAEAEAAVVGDTAAASAERRLANLRCNLWGAEKRGFAADVRRLDRAFVDLRRALRS